VQALTREGKPIGNNNGTSEPYTFGVTKEDNKCPANVFPEDKKKFTAEEAKKRNNIQMDAKRTSRIRSLPFKSMATDGGSKWRYGYENESADSN
jgi:hypothetical protein